MKTRVVSAFIALILILPFFIVGDIPFNFLVYLIALYGMKEFLDIRKCKKDIPWLVQGMSYLFLTLMLLLKDSYLSYREILSMYAGFFLMFLLPVILFYKEDKYDINDAFYLSGGTFFLSLGFRLFIYMRELGISPFIYLILISTMTDTYAYITGILIGKNKLIPKISPKKTLEGLIGGTIFGTFIPTYFYIVVINQDESILKITLITLFLSLLGTFGDLFFSSIKRFYGKKDFSNIMPGHGGVLDRLDSLIFIVLGFMIFFK